MKRAMSFNLFCRKDNTLPLNSCLLLGSCISFAQWANGVRATKACSFFFASFDDAKMLSNLGVALKFQQPDVCNCPFYSFLFFGRSSFFNFGAGLHY